MNTCRSVLSPPYLTMATRKDARADARFMARCRANSARRIAAPDADCLRRSANLRDRMQKCS